VNQANFYVHPVFATAIVTDKTTSKQTAYPIILQGVTVGVPHSVETIQSGVGVQMQSWVRGSLNPKVHWSMRPALGALTTAGLFTAPAVTSPQSTLMTVRSVADPEAFTTVRVTVFPAGGVYMRMGWLAKPWTDSKGRVWQPEFFGRIGPTFTGYTFPSTPTGLQDWQIWQYAVGNWGGDFYFRLRVPNGTYTVTLYMAAHPGPNNDATLAPHVSEFAIECMGEIVNLDYDLALMGGGKRSTPLTYAMTANVTNGVLEFAERQLLGSTVPTNTAPALNLDAVSIVPKGFH
jgi:hypothetical protein